MENKGNIYFVPTPIGNLGDITLRALDVLKEADVIFSEDTRSTLKLLTHYGIKNQVKSFHKDNEKKSVDTVLKLFYEGKNIAVVSEAGMPCISDPGSMLVRRLCDEGIEFQVLPGATASVVALIKSGFPADNFYFKGFLSHKKGEKSKEINKLKDINSTIILYESPHRIIETLGLLVGKFEKICVVRELTKIFEEKIYISSLKDIEKITLKGEFVIVIDNNFDKNESEKLPEVQDLIKKLKNTNFNSKQIMEILKVLGFKRNEVYPLLSKSNE
ncbi:16S rRNA (cytidine(1402)-2'-O)-methyltransferase [Deferribacteraceae bacterium V6Fe1]|nr:16S rRNA (cytidine(1402)-2'-O)-methyltransferase [Deferribacteraceae bacterium V6Fe1]